MKLKTYKGLGTKVVLTITPEEAISLMSVLINQLCNKKSNNKSELITTMECGASFCALIDFDNE